MSAANKSQTRDDKRRILTSLPPETKRVQVIGADGRTAYKRPDDVDVDTDQIALGADGKPVIMRGRPGRKPKVHLQPVSSHVEEVVEARDEHVESSALFTAARTNPEGDDVLNEIIAAMAQEAAAVEFERMEAERHGAPTSNISAKRARILKGMADTYLKRRDKGEGGVDMDSPAFEAVMGFMFETIQGVMKDSGMRKEHIETVFAKLSKVLDDSWKAEAQARMKK
jgi:hypothetical protein